MKPANPFSPALAIIVSIALLAGCSKPAADKTADAPEKTEAPAKAGVTIDAETQARIGLKTETPVPAQWQPPLKCRRLPPRAGQRRGGAVQRGVAA
jgi:hypothetical protein